MKRLRLLIFSLFVGIFLVSCPLVILYALGYVVKPGTERGLVKTGLIYLSTAPPGASVYLGNSRYTRTTPTVLRDLLPGTYEVTLALRRYRPWTHTVPVEAEQATVLERILLVPQHWHPATLLAGPFRSLWPVPGAHALLVAGGPHTEDLTFYDWRDGRSWPVVDAASLYWGLKVVSCLPVPDSPAVLLRVAHGAHEHVLWVELKADAARIEDLTLLVPEWPFRVAWDVHERRYLFVEHRGVLNRVDLAAQEVMPDVMEDVRAFAVVHRDLYVLTTHQDVLRVSLDGTVQERLLEAFLEGRSLIADRGEISLTAMSPTSMLLLGERGELAAGPPPVRVLDKGAVGLVPDVQQERVLVWQRDKLGLLEWPREPDTRDALMSREPRLRWVFTQAHAIEQVFWVYEGSHALFRDEDRVSLVELDPYGTPHLEPLVQIRRHSAFAYAEETGRLYYLDRQHGALMAIDVLPKQGLPLFPFPERNEPTVHRQPHPL